MMKNSDDRFYKCMQIEECPNCFARTKEGYCIALTNVDFIKRCPFYRDKDEYHQELKRLRIGRN